ncbi:hypothetical protein PFISCL1PPCAC_14463, partial [Pristionchus fissidentatus]
STMTKPGPTSKRTLRHDFQEIKKDLESSLKASTGYRSDEFHSVMCGMNELLYKAVESVELMIPYDCSLILPLAFEALDRVSVSMNSQKDVFYKFARCFVQFMEVLNGLDMSILEDNYLTQCDKYPHGDPPSLSRVHRTPKLEMGPPLGSGAVPYKRGRLCPQQPDRLAPSPPIVNPEENASVIPKTEPLDEDEVAWSVEKMQETVSPGSDVPKEEPFYEEMDDAGVEKNMEEKRMMKEEMQETLEVWKNIEDRLNGMHGRVDDHPCCSSTTVPLNLIDDIKEEEGEEYCKEETEEENVINVTVEATKSAPDVERRLADTLLNANHRNYMRTVIRHWNQGMLDQVSAMIGPSRLGEAEQTSPISKTNKGVVAPIVLSRSSVPIRKVGTPKIPVQKKTEMRVDEQRRTFFRLIRAPFKANMSSNRSDTHIRLTPLNNSLERYPEARSVSNDAIKEQPIGEECHREVPSSSTCFVSQPWIRAGNVLPAPPQPAKKYTPCPFCNTRLPVPTIENHIQLVHKQSWLKFAKRCQEDDCDYRSVHDSHVKQHTAAVHGTRYRNWKNTTRLAFPIMTRCPFCPRFLINVTQFIEHMNEDHSTLTSNEAKIFICDWCTFSTDRCYKMYAHWIERDNRCKGGMGFDYVAARQAHKQDLIKQQIEARKLANSLKHDTNYFQD